MTSNYHPPALLPVGNTIIVYTAVDQSGNSVTCTFNIKVID